MTGDRASVSIEAGRVAVNGPMTFDTVGELFGLPASWQAAGKALVIDLAGVARADSAGLALMLEWLRQARAAGLSLDFVNIPDGLQDLLRVVGLKPLFPTGNNG